MAQMGWVFLDDRGGRHRVGLYHGDQSGHVMIHCNLRVVQIDFSVKESKTYSFFIEDELCEVHIYKEPDGRFGYEFVVNKTVDTPRNRIRRVDERRIRRQMVVFIAGFVAVIIAGVLGFQWLDRWNKTERLTKSSLFSNLSEENVRRLSLEGKTDTAHLFTVREAMQRKVFYGFTTAGSLQISGAFTVPDTGQILLPNGFPLTDRDAFLVTYLPSDPQIHRLDFNQPTHSTIETYVRMASAAERRAHPDISDKRSICHALSAAELKGWQSLADFIFQTKSVEENDRHNRDSYLRLVRDVDYARVVEEECWDK
ncbi:MAG: hypothetical protein DYG98_19025 [Haliscomenobacteraceae bacterium CHB4]|nr:hypothetical protein [Saprospiraceae bacterium]MCE7925152.1 hypothetical protein [Haliscomenobacteraceae bacterium CHB4]